MLINNKIKGMVDWNCSSHTLITEIKVVCQTCVQRCQHSSRCITSTATPPWSRDSHTQDGGRGISGPPYAAVRGDGDAEAALSAAGAHSDRKMLGFVHGQSWPQVGLPNRDMHHQLCGTLHRHNQLCCQQTGNHTCTQQWWRLKLGSPVFLVCPCVQLRLLFLLGLKPVHQLQISKSDAPVSISPVRPDIIAVVDWA